MDPDPSTDAILQALAKPERRILLRELADQSTQEVSVDALEEVLTRELGGPPPEVRSTTEVAIQLRHVDLPRLDDVGLCAYDAQRECVEYRPNEFVETLLELLEERRSPGRIH